MKSYVVSLGICDHSITCHTTQVNTPCFNPSQRQVLDLPNLEGSKAQLTYVTGYCTFYVKIVVRGPLMFLYGCLKDMTMKLFLFCDVCFIVFCRRTSLRNLWLLTYVLPLHHQFLVFMLRGISAKWKQPLGYFLVNGSVKPAVLKCLVYLCLDKLMSIGL